MLASDGERVDNGRQVGAPVPLDEIGGIAFELGQLMRRHRQAQNASTAEERGTKHGTGEGKAATSRPRPSAGGAGLLWGRGAKSNFGSARGWAFAPRGSRWNPTSR